MFNLIIKYLHRLRGKYRYLFYRIALWALNRENVLEIYDRNSISTTSLAEKLNCKRTELFKLFTEAGWIEFNDSHKYRLTGKGITKGGTYRLYYRRDIWIAWPHNIINDPVIQNFKNSKHQLPR